VIVHLLSGFDRQSFSAFLALFSSKASLVRCSYDEHGTQPRVKRSSVCGCMHTSAGAFIFRMIV